MKRNIISSKVYFIHFLFKLQELLQQNMDPLVTTSLNNPNTEQMKVYLKAIHWFSESISFSTCIIIAVNETLSQMDQSICCVCSLHMPIPIYNKTV